MKLSKLKMYKPFDAYLVLLLEKNGYKFASTFLRLRIPIKLRWQFILTPLSIATVVSGTSCLVGLRNFSRISTENMATPGDKPYMLVDHSNELPQAPERIWKWGAPVRSKSGGTEKNFFLVVPLHFLAL